MSCGIIARCDAGGLASITREVFRHLRPERTLLLDLGDRGRSECVADGYEPEDGQSVYRASFAGALPESAIDWLTAPGVDVVHSCETFYDDRILRAARANDIRTVVLAMPELAPWADGALSHDPSAPRPSVITVPTMWREHTLPTSTLLPVPVATDRLRFKQRDRVDHLYHPTGAAMLDRNGTDLFLRALTHMETAPRVTIRSERAVTIPRDVRADVTIVETPTNNYWDQYPADADVLVLPRRYGGLSLPVQECAALGIPAVMLANDVYAQHRHVIGVEPSKARPARMKGGTVPVWDADPRELARALDDVVQTGVWHASHYAGYWARQHAWSGPLGARWCQMLDAGCAAEVAA